MAGEVSIADSREEAEALSEVMGDLERRSERFGAALTSAMQAAVTGGKGLDDVLRGLGLMGEAGAEAILPLKRGSDGALGVAAPAGGGGAQIVFNVTATDAASFRKSEGQIAAMLARSVGRGQRGL